MPVLFLSNSVKHWPTLCQRAKSYSGMQHQPWRLYYSFAHLTLMLLLNYLMNCEMESRIFGAHILGSEWSRLWISLLHHKIIENLYCHSHCFMMIKSSRQLNSYSLQRFLTEFPPKNWTRRGLEYVLSEIDKYGTAEGVPGIGDRGSE